jgi:hypothetical protein
MGYKLLSVNSNPKIDKSNKVSKEILVMYYALATRQHKDMSIPRHSRVQGWVP